MKRSAPRSTVLRLGVSVTAVAAALLVSMLIIWLSGKSPTGAIHGLYVGSFGQRVQLGGTLEETVPLLLVGLGWIVAFSAGRVNIGFVGQIVAGGITATYVGVSLPGLPAVIHLPLAILAGVFGGAVWAAIAAWLWARHRVNEIISTLLLNFVAIEILSWVVGGPLQVASHAFPQSEHIAQSARWPVLLSGTPLSWDILLVLVVLAVVAFLPRTTFGVRLRLTGGNPAAARYAGVCTVRVSVLALIMSGALGGLAGSSLILAGDLKSLTDSFQGTFGFEGIVVALLAMNSPLGALPAALLLAALDQGAGFMQALSGVPSSVVLITDGLVILFVAAASFLLRRSRTAREEGLDVGPTSRPVPVGTAEAAPL